MDLHEKALLERLTKYLYREVYPNLSTLLGENNAFSELPPKLFTKLCAVYHIMRFLQNEDGLGLSMQDFNVNKDELTRYIKHRFLESYRKQYMLMDVIIDLHEDSVNMSRVDVNMYEGPLSNVVQYLGEPLTEKLCGGINQYTKIHNSPESTSMGTKLQVFKVGQKHFGTIITDARSICNSILHEFKEITNELYK